MRSSVDMSGAARSAGSLEGMEGRGGQLLLATVLHPAARHELFLHCDATLPCHPPLTPANYELNPLETGINKLLTLGVGYFPQQ